MTNKRERPRININHILTCTCHGPGDNHNPQLEAMLINISMSGSLIETREPLESEVITLCNDAGRHHLCVKGTIVHKSSDGSVFGSHRSGIEFTDHHDITKEFIVSIVKPEEYLKNKARKAMLPQENDTTLLVSNSEFNESMLNITVKELDEPDDEFRSIEDFIEDDITETDPETPIELEVSSDTLLEQIPDLLDESTDSFEDALIDIEDILDPDSNYSNASDAEPKRVRETIYFDSAEPDDDEAVSANHSTPVTDREVTPEPESDTYNSSREQTESAEPEKPVSHTHRSDSGKSKSINTPPFLTWMNIISITSALLIILGGIVLLLLKQSGKIDFYPEIPFLNQHDLTVMELPMDIPAAIERDNPVFTTDSITSYYFKTSRSNTLFIIRGFINTGATGTVRPLKVTARLLDKTRSVTQFSTVYAGYNLTDTQLNIMEIQTVEMLLGTTPKQPVNKAVPFTVVFTDVPATTRSFSIDIDN